MRSGLLQALRIQQVRFVVVSTSPSPERDAQDTEPVFSLLDRHAALLAVWAEAGETQLILHIAGHRGGEPFVERMRFELGDEPAIDRAFALKIRDVLDELVIARLSLSLPAVGPPPPAPTLPPPAARAQAPPPSPERLDRSSWLLELGGRGMDGNGHGSGHMAVVLAGARQTRPAPGDRGAVEVYTELALTPATTATSIAGEVTTSTIEGMLGLRALTAPPRSRLEGRGAHRLSAGVYLGTGARLARARGSTQQGATGAAQRLGLALAAGVEARLRIAPRLAVRAAIGGVTSLRRQRFAVNETPVTDLGRYRAQGQLSLLLSLP